MQRIRQAYHLEAPRGLLNDPNGLSYFKGKYYIFFQWNRFAKNHSYKEWGLFTSTDLLNYEFQGSAIIPSQNYDIDGVFSGSGYIINDKLYLYYTGNSEKTGKAISSQCLVITEDGKHFEKKGIIIPAPNEYTEHFRDPKIFSTDNKNYYLIVGGQRKNDLKGTIILYHSTDGITWQLKNTLAISQQYEMIECPDLFSLNENDILLYNLQQRDNIKNEPLQSFSVYKIGKFNETTGKFNDIDLDNNYTLIDNGFDFFAPQTFLSPDGRRIMFAWMSRMNDAQEKLFAQTQNNIHCLTLPRELYLKNHKLYQKPIKELYKLLGNTIPVNKSHDKWEIYPAKRTFFINLQNIDSQKDLEINFHDNEAIIKYNAKQKQLTFSRKNWETNIFEEKTSIINNLTEIEIWSDYSSIEIFINNGEIVSSSRILPQNSNLKIMLKTQLDNLAVQVNEINK